MSSVLPASLTDRVDQVLQEMAGKPNLPAVAVALVDKDSVAYMRAFGQTPSGAPADAETTAFMVASTTKTIVALCCLQCAEKDELALDVDINVYLPVDCQVKHPLGIPITVLDLLRHKSGLRDDEGALLPGPWRTEGGDCTVTLLEYIRKRLADGDQDIWDPHNPPGTIYHYSNLGFALLGLVIECATGVNIGELCDWRIFSRLGMVRSRFFLSEMLDLPDTEVVKPHREGIGLKHYGVAEYPAAQLRSTAGDMARYLLHFTQHLDLDTADEEYKAVINKEHLDLLLPSNFKDGLAWWGKDAQYSSYALPSLGRLQDIPVWQHGGYMDGVRTHMFLWPWQRVGAVILTNSDCSSTLYDRIIPALVDSIAILMEGASSGTSSTDAAT